MHPFMVCHSVISWKKKRKEKWVFLFFFFSFNRNFLRIFPCRVHVRQLIWKSQELSCVPRFFCFFFKHFPSENTQRHKSR